ncbi:hypothetical protein J2Y02_004925 [Neobacillus drentensis]|nr:hypothetical protein [Neobacillus drentensis]
MGRERIVDNHDIGFVAVNRAKTNCLFSGDNRLLFAGRHKVAVINLSFGLLLNYLIALTHCLLLEIETTPFQHT